jgi:hypothetical protein
MRDGANAPEGRLKDILMLVSTSITKSKPLGESSGLSLLDDKRLLFESFAFSLGFRHKHGHLLATQRTRDAELADRPWILPEPRDVKTPTRCPRSAKG